MKDAGDIWTIKTQDQYMGQVYQMVQPAVVLVDASTGKTIKECTWSWKTMGITKSDLTELYEVTPGVHLVTYRPVIADLPPRSGSVARSSSRTRSRSSRRASSSGRATPRR